jgi:hypothetical protein
MDISFIYCAHTHILSVVCERCRLHGSTHADTWYNETRDIHLTPSLFASLLRVAPVYNSILMKFSLCCVTGCSRFYRTFPTDEFRPVTNSHALLSHWQNTWWADWTSCSAKNTRVFVFIQMHLSLLAEREKNHRELTRLGLDAAMLIQKNMTLPPAVNQVEKS